MPDNLHPDSKPSFLKKFFLIIKKYLVKFGTWQRATFEKVWPGMAIGAAVGAILFVVLRAYFEKTGLSTTLNIILLLIFALLVFNLAYIISYFGFKFLRNWPPKMVAAILASIILLFFLDMMMMGIQLMVTVLILGGILSFAFKRGIKKPLSIIYVLLVVSFTVFLIYEFNKSGYDTTAVLTNTETAAAAPALFTDPSAEGEYAVNELFYGSGWDKQRAEFGKKTNIKTAVVDVTPFVKELDGWKGMVRRWYWGFDFKHIPVNGRVWYPAGEGKYPLVLIVHGNHKMEEHSDPGYEYLGRLMASRGFIFVSVDQNFLNGNWAGDYSQEENFTRGWLLLEHLRNWRKWNGDEKNIFFNKVDLDNIALIGHSRGGQAAAIAAAINKLKKYHIDAVKDFDFNFNIKGIVQIAPNDPYNPQTDIPLKLKNINYLLLHGGHDADMNFFMGNRMYNRLSFDDSGYYFKSTLYIYRANHGQFNTVWGGTDMQKPYTWSFNLKPLLSGEEQRKIAKVYISAFLETILKDKNDYIPLFKDYRTGRNLLPKDYYISQFEDSRFIPLLNYEEDFDVLSASDKTCTVEGENLKVWSENGITFRNGGGQHNNVAYIGWDKSDSTLKDKTAGYYINILQDELTREKNTFLFSACNNKETDGDTVNFTIRFEDYNNETVIIEFHEITRLNPRLKIQLMKWGFLNEFGMARNAENTLQRVEIPFELLKEKNPEFNTIGMKRIGFIFDKTESGELIFDNIGFN